MKRHEGEVAVIGLARSGVAACRLLRRDGAKIYASDLRTTPELEKAAAELRAEGCDVELGVHDAVRIGYARLVVASPGVPPDSFPLRMAAEHGVPVISEMDLAAQHLKHSRLIVTTGTKGKSTTASMIAAILAANSLGPAEVAGNIGTPLSDVALEESPPPWLSVEASSFQLHDSPHLSPAVGVLTNLSADHLDRYKSVAEYYADKKLMFRNASLRSRWVTNGDDQAVVGLSDGVVGGHERFSLDVALADAWFDRSGGWLILRGMPLMRRADLHLLGEHNVANALAAALAVPPDESDRDRIAEALKGFRALHHRLEPVREVGGVLWVNDSKATTVSSAASAVQAMDRPVVLLLGGKDKGGDFKDLAPALRGARGVIAYGEAGERVKRELNGSARVTLEGSDFEKVLSRARAMAQAGDVVLLSPACSSFDMFENAEQRGDIFTKWVQSL
ncbi:MAG TPA: UDP-N-acetylmuramoyl-L-alanine--D-glutamate ligase [Gemmatimonadales bacterium]